MNFKLREWEKSDAKNLAHTLSNKKVQNNLTDGIPFPYTERDALEYIEFVKGLNPNDSFVYAVEADEKVVGCIGTFRQENVYSRTAKIGYYLDEEYWGKGIMTKAVKKLCQKIFDTTDIVRIYADVFRYNIGSRRVLEKAGFSFE